MQWYSIDACWMQKQTVMEQTWAGVSLRVQGSERARRGRQEPAFHSFCGSSGPDVGRGDREGDPELQGPLPPGSPGRNGVSEPTLRAVVTVCPSAGVACPSTEEGFLLTSKASPSLLVHSLSP